MSFNAGFGIPKVCIIIDKKICYNRTKQKMQSEFGLMKKWVRFASEISGFKKK